MNPEFLTEEDKAELPLEAFKTLTPEVLQDETRQFVNERVSQGVNAGEFFHQFAELVATQAPETIANDGWIEEALAMNAEHMSEDERQFFVAEVLPHIRSLHGIDGEASVAIAGEQAAEESTTAPEEVEADAVEKTNEGFDETEMVTLEQANEAFDEAAFEQAAQSLMEQDFPDSDAAANAVMELLGSFASEVDRGERGVQFGIPVVQESGRLSFVPLTAYEDAINAIVKAQNEHGATPAAEYFRPTPAQETFDTMVNTLFGKVG